MVKKDATPMTPPSACALFSKQITVSCDLRELLKYDYEMI